MKYLLDTTALMAYFNDEDGEKKIVIEKGMEL